MSYSKNGKPLGRPREDHWLSTPEILDYLNISRHHLYRLRDNCFKAGYHYIDISKVKDFNKGLRKHRPTFRWNWKRIDNLFSNP